MNQYTVALRWAKQSHPKCKTRTFFFKGDTIYSYGHHWPLGRIITLTDSKRKVALINDVFYSNSTSRHHSQARFAALRAPDTTVCSVESDLFHTVQDEKSLARAVHVTFERLKDRQYEDRLLRNESSRRDRENNADQARRDLENLLDVDCDPMSAAFAVKLRNLLLGVPGNNFRANNRWKYGGRRGGLAESHPDLVEALTDILTREPERMKQPGYVLALLNNLKSLAA
jgi:hypothetical protein